MAKERLNKFSVIGLDTDRTNLINDLMKFGVTQLNSQDSKLTDDDWASMVTKGGNDEDVSALESRISVIENVIRTLEIYDTSKNPLFKCREVVNQMAFDAVVSECVSIDEDIEKVRELSNSLKLLQGEKNKIETTIAGLIPWRNYDIPLEVTETKNVFMQIGIVPITTTIEEVKEAVSAATNLCEVSQIGSDGGQIYLSVIFIKEEEDKVKEVFKEIGFGRISFKNLKGTAKECTEKLKREKNAVDEKIQNIEYRLSGLVIQMDNIKWLHDKLVIERDAAKANRNTLETTRTFYLDGWVPVRANEAVSELFDKYGCSYEFAEPEEEEDVPVLLRNNRAVYPIEVVTEMYSLPNNKEIDPTPIYSFFYLMFFGLMFGDLGYGAILTIICVLILKKFNLEGTSYKLVKSFAYAGVSTMFWGLMFGSFFGNLTGVIGASFFDNPDTGLKPLWFDSLEDPVKLLIFSCVFGTVHVFVGMGIKAYELIREGRILEAFNEVFSWYILLIGLVFLLAGDSFLFAGASEIGKWMSIGGAALIIVLPVFLSKGMGKVGGLWNLYGITGYMADILSYSRLLALGLATTVISQVVNMLGSFTGDSFIGVILFIVIVVFGHIFNFAINGLGSYVHSIRLQYVEFFGKFYEGGGTPFEPFNRKTKYVELVKEEK